METRIYMAGKISSNGWRFPLIQGEEKERGNGYDLRNHDYWGVWGEETKEKYLSFPNKNLIYVGPFFTCCDHGCSHGNSTHGVGENGCIEKTPPKKEVFEGCIKQISDADYIFCWIDSLDCYGTLFELGIAYEKGKKIFIGINKNLEPKEVPICKCGNDFSDRPDQVGKGCCHSGGINPDDLWFIKNSGYSDYCNNSNDAWNKFLGWLNENNKNK